MIKPSRAQRHIAFRRNPITAIALPGSQKPLIDVSGSRLAAVRRNGREGRPGGLGSHPFFISHPPYVRPDVTENNSRGLQLACDGPGLLLPFVIGRSVDPAHFVGTAVIAIAPVGA